MDEIGRIEAAYRERDRGTSAQTYRYGNPAFQFHVAEIEWALMRALREQGIELEGARVLEVGAGTGTFLGRLVEFGAAEGIGVDLSPKRVEEGRRLRPRLDLRVANGAELPFADGSFDLVTQFTCLSSILDEGTRAAVAAEMWRVVRPGGAVLSYDMRPTPPLLAAAMGAYGRLRGVRHGDRGTPTRPVSEAELARWFPHGGLHVRAVSLSFDLAVLARRSRALASLLAAVPALRTHLLAVVRRPG